MTIKKLIPHSSDLFIDFGNKAFMLNFLRSLPMRLFFSIILAIGIAQYLNLNWICRFYTLSSLFIDVLIITLPIIVFIYILSAIMSMERSSPLLILFIFITVTLSNSMALVTAFCVGKIVIPQFSLPSLSLLTKEFTSTIRPLICIRSPFNIATDTAMYTGIILGIAASFLSADSFIKITMARLSFYSRDAITHFLQKIFIPLLPLYVFGFALKLSYEGSLNFLINSYTQIFIVSLLIITFYIFLYYFIAAQGSWRQTLKYLRSMIPAGLTGFSTMSSAATMPVTLQCTKINLKNGDAFSELVVPSTANIHMLGDDISIILIAFSLLLINGSELPDFIHFIPFICAYCMAKLSCVGIPGASVLVVLPVLQNYLGFTPEMTAMLTTLYFLQDPFGTCANVMGNGAFAIILHKIAKQFKTLTC